MVGSFKRSNNLPGRRSKGKEKKSLGAREAREAREGESFTGAKNPFSLPEQLSNACHACYRSKQGSVLPWMGHELLGINHITVWINQHTEN